MNSEESFEDRLQRWTLNELNIELTKVHIYSERKLNRIRTRIAELTFGDINSQSSPGGTKSNDKMKIFVSWSGEVSHTVAVALRDWIPTVLPHVTAWVSSLDIDKGSRWSIEIGNELENSDFGIFCLVPGNMHEPWLNFEAGAISKSLQSGMVAPLTIGISPNEITGPLSQFQVTEFGRDDMFKLVSSINKSSRSPLPGEKLLRNFKVCWLYLEKAIDRLGIQPGSNQEGALSESESMVLIDVDDKIVSYLIEHDGRGELTTNAISRAIGEHLSLVKLRLSKLYDQGYVYKVKSSVSGPKFAIDDKGREYAVDHNLL